MTDRCETAAVLGAGVMGTALAAHLAGAGIRTYLLDIVPPKLSEGERALPAARNGLATAAIERALKSKPATFYDPDAARLITPGNFDDHLDKLSECDLVIEAVVERLDIKQALFKRLEGVLAPEAILASNTSGLSVAKMSESLPPELQKRFIVLHFFNPVRYMRLLEIVPGPHTEPAIVARAARIGELLGKGVVYGKDTPNFVANRIGIYSIMQAVRCMEDAGLSIEEVDKIAGKPMGRPASAAFRTADLVGIDTFLHVADNCYADLSEDPERAVFQAPDWMRKLVADGRLGQKSGAGFYKKVGADIQVLDPVTLAYRAQKKVRFDSLGVARGIDEVGERLRTLVAADDAAGRYAWKTLALTLCYAANRVGEIASDIVNIDRAMRWGFNWDLGPFEAWDAIGVADSVGRMQREGMVPPAWVVAMLKGGRTSFYDGPQAAPRYFDVVSRSAANFPREPEQILLAALHEDKKRIVKENLGATLIDLGDGVLGFEVHTKMNTMDDDVIGLLDEAVGEAERNFSALVIANDGEHFGAGANLMLVYMAIQQGDFATIDRMVRAFQAAMQRVRYARVPVVAAPHNYTFGGAAELSMAATACQAYAETYMGLVEAGVGLVPAGGGCLRLVQRFSEPVSSLDGADLLPAIGQASLNIAMARVSTGAEDARRLRYLRDTDGISLGRSQLLYQAKQRALGLARSGYRPPMPRLIRAAGVDAAASIGMRVWGLVESQFASTHDALIANKVAHILCGGQVAAGTLVTEEHYLDLEREAFVELSRHPLTQARIQSILMNNKPLRN